MNKNELLLLEALRDRLFTNTSSFGITPKGLPKPEVSHLVEFRINNILTEFELKLNSSEKIPPQFATTAKALFSKQLYRLLNIGQFNDNYMRELRNQQIPETIRGEILDIAIKLLEENRDLADEGWAPNLPDVVKVSKGEETETDAYSGGGPAPTTEFDNKK